MESQNGLVQMECKVLNFKLNAARDHYDDGGFAVFHATELEVLQPESPPKLTIYHDANREIAAYWKEEGKIVRFSIPATLLKRDMIFAAALQNVEAP